MKWHYEVFMLGLSAAKFMTKLTEQNNIPVENIKITESSIFISIVSITIYYLNDFRIEK